MPADAFASRAPDACALTWGQVCALIAEMELAAARAHRKELDAGSAQLEWYWQAVGETMNTAAQSLRNAALVADATREDTHP